MFLLEFTTHSNVVKFFKDFLQFLFARYHFNGLLDLGTWSLHLSIEKNGFDTYNMAGLMFTTSRLVIAKINQCIVGQITNTMG